MGALDQVIFWGLGDTALEIVSLKNPSPVHRTPLSDTAGWQSRWTTWRRPLPT